MSRRVELPTLQHVRQARDNLLARSIARGSRPSVLALARELGLTNTTFWRNYPEVAREIADARRGSATSAATTPRTSTERVGATALPDMAGPQRSPTDTLDANAPAALLRARLRAARRDNRALRDQLELAAASIARLTLENQQMRHALQQARGVSVLDPASRQLGLAGNEADTP